MNKFSDAFKHLQKLFPKLSSAKIKEGILLGHVSEKLSQIYFSLKKLNKLKRSAWMSIVEVT